MNLQTNPRFRDLIPALSTDEYAGLEESIVQDGCRDAIVAWNDTIIDGHNRYAICTEHGIPFDVFPMEFESESDAEIWIIKNQFGRRNINAAVRSVLALRLEPLIAAKAKERQMSTLKQNTDTPTLAERGQGETREEIAKLAGVSHGTIDKVKKVMAFGTEEVKQKMQSGEITINKAFGASMPDKTCTLCGKTLPASAFYQGKAQCKRCKLDKAAERTRIRNGTNIDPALRLQAYDPNIVVGTQSYTEEQEECLDITRDYYCHVSAFAMTPRIFDGIDTDSDMYKTLIKVQKAITKILGFMEGEK